MSVQFLPFLIPERTSADINADNLDVFGGSFMTTVELVHSPYIGHSALELEAKQRANPLSTLQ